MANDPHLGVQIPSIWYEVGLHCTLKSTECPYNVTGFSFAGMIGVIIGHSDRIAWGVTNVESDVMDLYIEKINPQNPNQYEVNGKWVDMQLVQETIQVAGNQPIVQTVRYTRHGPILSDVSLNLKQFQPSQPLEIPQNYAVALRWTALAPSKLGYAISLKDVQQIQGDDRNLNAQTLVPLLQSITVDTPQLQAAQKLLRDWNLQLGMTSPAAALYEETEIIDRIFAQVD